jgi:hypothetical protein
MALRAPYPQPARGPTAWRRPPPRRRPVISLAVALILIALLGTNLAGGDDAGPRRLIADPLNRLIAWADLNLELSPRLGAVRAVRLDPALRTGLGRQGARWFATNGTPAERLRYAAALAARDPRERPLLRAAIVVALCSPDRQLRRAASVAATRARISLKNTAVGRQQCRATRVQPIHS